jgi:hypothetical protein
MEGGFVKITEEKLHSPSSPLVGSLNKLDTVDWHNKVFPEKEQIGVARYS